LFSIYSSNSSSDILEICSFLLTSCVVNQAFFITSPLVWSFSASGGESFLAIGPGFLGMSFVIFQAFLLALRDISLANLWASSAIQALL